MKKTLGILSMLLVVGLVSTLAYAETSTPITQTSRANIEEREAWFKERMQWKKEQINEALKEGLITKEESKIWNDHFSYMEKFHKENGFMSGCDGLGNRNNQKGYRTGLGGRMMKGNKWSR